MQIKLTKKRKRRIAIYLALVIVLYLIIYILPKITDVFETTQILESGVLEISCETSGYIVKDEAVVLADRTGAISYLMEDGTVVKKGSDICDIKKDENESKDKPKKKASKYTEYLSQLKNFDGIYKAEDSPISGIFVKSIDGGEKYFNPENLDKITKEKAEEIKLKELGLDREDVVKGEPVYKITGDDHWYVVCWIDREDAKEYEEGDSVTLTFPDGEVEAELQSKTVDKSDKDKTIKFVFYMNTYYENLAKARETDITVTMSNSSGLIVDNECLIKKDGRLGVYVKTKDDVYVFKPVNVKASNSKQTAISDGTYVNDKYEQVQTVNVYDEVLRNPQSALENENKEKNKKEDKNE